ncbi:MAG: PqqD family protein [bacterium]|nr:PqqD family protein [bacterium]
MENDKQCSISNKVPRPELGTKVKRKEEELAWREIEGEILLLHIPSGKFYTLNKIASYIWKQFDGDKSISTVVDVIKRDCAIPQNKSVDVKADVLEFVTNLLQEGLVSQV